MLIDCVCRVNINDLRGRLLRRSDAVKDKERLGEKILAVERGYGHDSLVFDFENRAVRSYDFIAVWILLFPEFRRRAIGEYHSGIPKEETAFSFGNHFICFLVDDSGLADIGMVSIVKEPYLLSFLHDVSILVSRIDPETCDLALVIVVFYLVEWKRPAGRVLCEKRGREAQQQE